MPEPSVQNLMGSQVSMEPIKWSHCSHHPTKEECRKHVLSNLCYLHCLNEVKMKYLLRQIIRNHAGISKNEHPTNPFDLNLKSYYLWNKPGIFTSEKLLHVFIQKKNFDGSIFGPLMTHSMLFFSTNICFLYQIKEIVIIQCNTSRK